MISVCSTKRIIVDDELTHIVETVFKQHNEMAYVCDGSVGELPMKDVDVQGLGCNHGIHRCIWDLTKYICG